VGTQGLCYLASFRGHPGPRVPVGLAEASAHGIPTPLSLCPLSLDLPYFIGVIGVQVIYSDSVKRKVQRR